MEFDTDPDTSRYPIQDDFMALHVPTVYTLLSIVAKSQGKVQ